LMALALTAFMMLLLLVLSVVVVLVFHGAVACRGDNGRDSEGLLTDAVIGC
jgi:hypothetical protein